MANPVKTCAWVPYKNIYCRGPIGGISGVQPQNQILPDGRVVNNPAYVPEFGKSYWSYKFMIDCSVCSGGIQSIGIPVCQYLKAQSIRVLEKIDGCGGYKEVSFTLVKNDPAFKIAPAGYVWLKVENNGRYLNGVSVLYLLEVLGDYTEEILPEKVKTRGGVITFDCKGVLVPKCCQRGQLVVVKRCGCGINGGKATLNYMVDVINTGSSFFNKVFYDDTVHIPIELGLGKINVNPSTLLVNTSIPGQVTISGNLGSLSQGQVITAAYSIEIGSISHPQKYNINNIVSVYTPGAEAHASCLTVLDAVELDAFKYCRITMGNKGSFIVNISSAGNSPDTAADIEDFFSIPDGVTLRFNDFGGCTAVFRNGGGAVPIETDIEGPKDITITCKNIRILKDGCARKTILFTVISSSLYGRALIKNILDRVELSVPESQVFLGTRGLPAEAYIDVLLDINCRNKHKT